VTLRSSEMEKLYTPLFNRDMHKTC